MRKLAVIISAIVICITGTVAYAAITVPDPDGHVYVCVNKNSGQVLVRDKGDTCKAGFTPTRWVANENAIPVTTTYVKRSVVFHIRPALVGSKTIPCNAGDVAISGGFHGPPVSQILQSQPGPEDNDENVVSPPTEWQFQIFNTGPSDQSFADIFVVCQHTE
jgi:hypothetical protein